MSGGKPVFVSEMYLPRARMSLGLVHGLALCPSEETTFSRRSLACDRVGQVRLAAGRTLVRSGIGGRLCQGSHRTRRGGRPGPGSLSPLSFGKSF